MSRSKQEAVLLEERIEKIRRKNEEIRRRHEEVEADKQNAAKLNALVQVSAPTEDWTTGGKLETHHQSSAKVKYPEQYQQQESSGRGRPKEQIEYLRPQSVPNTKKVGAPKCYSFREGDGPPPDPSYRFLADVERDSERAFQTGRRGRGTGHQRGSFIRERGRGGLNYRGGHNSGGRPEGDVSRAEYEAWRAERNRIDSDRINRQKTAEGHWRREWDNEKSVQEEEDIRITIKDTKYSAPRRIDRKPYNENTRNTPKENYRYSGASDNGSTRIQENATERGGNNHRCEKQSRSLLQGNKPVPFQPNTPPKRVDAPKDSASDSWDEDGPKRTDRSVVSVGESIKICIRNSPSPAVPIGSTVRSVKVNPPVIAGTGRVGPRQRVRVSYSSQSEDEAVQQTPRSRPPRSVQQHHNTKSVPVQSGNSNTPPNKSQLQSQPDLKSKLPHEQSSAEPRTSKPPLPPSFPVKQENNYPKPRRQRNKKLETERSKKSGDKRMPETTNKVSQDLEKESKENSHKADDVDRSTGNESECGGDGDDSWEDVTTTSGNESVSEYPDENHPPNKKSTVRSVTFQDSNNIRICFKNNEKDERHYSDEKLAVKKDHSHTELQESINLSISLNNSENVEDNNCINIDQQNVEEDDNETSPSSVTNKEETNNSSITREIIKDEAFECKIVVTFDHEQNSTTESQEITVEEKQLEALNEESLESKHKNTNADDQQGKETTPNERLEKINENTPLSASVEGEKDTQSKETKDEGSVNG